MSDLPRAAGPEAADAALVRVEKIRVLSQISRLATEHGIRVLAAGGPVFAAQGLISPDVSRSVALVVDVEAAQDFFALLKKVGWVLSRGVRRMAVLPSAVVLFEHPQLLVRLAVYTAFPGFYVDAGRAFAILWARRNTMLLSGVEIPILDRLSTVIMAVHDRLGLLAWNPKARNYQQFHVEQFNRVLTPQERKDLLELVLELRAVEPMRPLLEVLGLDGGPITLPNEGYARWRLAIPSASPATLVLLGLAECPRQRRIAQVTRVLRENPKVVLVAVLGAPRAWWTILTARRRLRAARQELFAADR